MDLVIPQGKSWRVAFPVLGTFDPTGWSLRSQVRIHPGHPDVLHEWSTALGTAAFETVQPEILRAAGYQTTEPTLCVVLTVSPITSSTWTWEEGVYDIEASTDPENVVGVADGTVKVKQEVTR